MMPTSAKKSTLGAGPGVTRGPDGMYPLRRGLNILRSVMILKADSSSGLGVLVVAAREVPSPIRVSVNTETHRDINRAGARTSVRSSVRSPAKPITQGNPGDIRRVLRTKVRAPAFNAEPRT